MFNLNELDLLIAGVSTIDIEDWQRNTQYNGYTRYFNIP
jgi:hypothetical protein